MQTTAQPLQAGYRIQSIDFLRGLVMVIMALDHVRDYFHADTMLFDPTDLSQTNIFIFFTRWITHFCAPVFMFLAGTSAFLVGERKTKKQLSLFLLTRGLWLMLLEVTVVNFGWFFNPEFPRLLFIVIWALGFSMVILSALIHLPFKAILVIGILIVAGHNTLDSIHVSGNTFPDFLWAEMHEPHRFPFHGHFIGTGYPVLPWIGVMALGYCFGRLYKPDIAAAQRKKLLIIIGGTAIILFIILRLFNIYGDRNPWSLQSDVSLTIASFLNTTKYPPSLLYLLMTLGPAILLLAFLKDFRNIFSKAVIHIGRVPMFFYLIHIYLIHSLAMIAATVTGFGWKVMVLNGWPEIKGYGFSLVVVYLIWIIIILALYPLCKWYDKYKTAHKEKWWLSYL